MIVGRFEDNYHDVTSIIALRPGGPRHHTAAAPSSISLRVIHAFGVTEEVKAAYVVTVVFYDNYKNIIRIK